MSHSIEGNRLESTVGKLSRRQLDVLTRYADAARNAPLTELLREAFDHVADARLAHEDDPLINVPLAEALADVIRRLIDAWDVGHFKPEANLRPPGGIERGGQQYDAGYWLRGAVRYFSHGDDEEPDLISPLGFEDDAEVLNACLRLAGLDDWCLRPEDYDDA